MCGCSFVLRVLSFLGFIIPRLYMVLAMRALEGGGIYSTT